MRTLHALVLAALVIAVAGCAQTTTTTNDPDAQSVMDTIIPAVFGHWNINALAEAADPAAYPPLRIQRDRTFFSQLSRALGPMVRYDKAKGRTEITGTGPDQTKKASYDATVIFKNGSAQIHVEAAKKQGKWLIEDASVQPGRPLGVHPPGTH